MKAFLISLFFVASCSSEPRLTGYKYGGGWAGNKIKTCNEGDILRKWWYFETKNAIVNTLVPGFEDLCAFPKEDGVLFWNDVEGWGAWQDQWDWSCSDIDTMKVLDTDNNDVYYVHIFGKDPDGCYDIEVSDSGITVRGEMCPCDDPFEE